MATDMIRGRCVLWTQGDEYAAHELKRRQEKLVVTLDGRREEAIAVLTVRLD